MKKALIITWQGVQDSELLYPYYRLQEDFDVVDVMADKVGFVYGINGEKLHANLSVCQLYDTMLNGVFPDDYDLLVLPGGVKALEKLRLQENVIKFVKEFYESGKVVSAICHGPLLLISAKITKGKKISAYYSVQVDVENSGAEYVNAPVTVDGNLVTSCHYKDLSSWMLETIKLVNSRLEKQNRQPNDIANV